MTLRVVLWPLKTFVSFVSINVALSCTSLVLPSFLSVSLPAMYSCQTFYGSSITSSDMALIAYPVTSSLILQLPNVLFKSDMSNTLRLWSDRDGSSSSIIQECNTPNSGVLNMRLIIDVAWPLVGLVAFSSSLFYMIL